MYDGARSYNAQFLKPRATELNDVLSVAAIWYRNDSADETQSQSQSGNSSESDSDDGAGDARRRAGSHHTDGTSTPNSTRSASTTASQSRTSSQPRTPSTLPETQQIVAVSSGMHHRLRDSLRDPSEASPKSDNQNFEHNSPDVVPTVSRRRGIRPPWVHISPRPEGRGTYAAVEATAKNHADTLLAAKLRLYLLVPYSPDEADGNDGMGDPTLPFGGRKPRNDDSAVAAAVAKAFSGPRRSCFRKIATAHPNVCVVSGCLASVAPLVTCTLFLVDRFGHSQLNEVA